MKVIGKTEKHVEEEEFVKKVICDICKNDIKKKWSSWEASKVTIEAEIGSVYPECDSRDLFILDVCKECFLEKVKPLIEKSFNVAFRELSSEDRYSSHE